MQIEFVDMNKSFGTNHVLKDVSFTVNSGEMFGYLGRNGAGKTTLIRILMDVFKADSGEILIDGKPFSTKDYRIGYLPEERGMYQKSKVMDQLTYFAMLRGATRKEAQDSINFWAKRLQIDEYLPRVLETLSKGNQQKVQITQAFLNSPDILILDEPFSGLDPVNSKIFQDALSEYVLEDRIVVFSSHQMGYIESFCDALAIIDKGKIVLHGSLAKIKKDLGHNRIRLSVNDLANNLLQEEIVKTFGVKATLDRQSVIISLTSKFSKFDILHYLAEKKHDVRLFSDFEPSLQDIFIHEVGENNETV